MVLPISKLLIINPHKIVFYDGIEIVISLIMNHYSRYILLSLGLKRAREVSSVLFFSSLFSLYWLSAQHLLTTSAYILTVTCDGMALGLLYPSLNHLVLQMRNCASEKSRYLSLLNVSWSCGYLVCGAMVSRFLYLQSLASILLISVFFLLYLLLDFLFLNPADCVFQQHTSRDRVPRSIFFIGLILASVTFSQNSIEYWMPVVMNLSHGISLSSCALIMTFFGVAQATGRLLFGVFAAKLKIVTFSIIPFVGFFFAVVVSTFVDNFAGFFVCIILMGLSSSCLLPVIMTLSAEFGIKPDPKHTCFFIFMNTLGSGLSFAFNGIGANALPPHEMSLGAPVFLLLGLILLLCLCCGRWRVHHHYDYR